MTNTKRIIDLSSILLTAILITIFVTYSYFFMNNRYPNNNEFFLFIPLLALLLVFIKRNTLLGIILFSSASHIALTILYGVQVPYIAFIPIIIGFLIQIKYEEKYIKYYFYAAVGVTLLELLPQIPIDKSLLESGISNILIFAILQALTYYLIFINFKAISTWIKIAYTNLNSLPKHNSTNFINTIIAKGLYSSMIFHFINNFINQISWKTYSQSQAEIIKIFADRMKDEQEEKYSTYDVIMSLVNFFTEKEVAFELDIDKSLKSQHIYSKLILIVLYDLLINAIKYGKGEIYLSAKKNNSLKIKISNLIDKSQSNHHRNTSITNNFLNMLNLGEIITQKNNNTFIAELILKKS